MACATEGIYLLQTRELITMNKNIYKIGRSFNLNKRMKQYPKESNLILLVECCNSVKCEAELLKIFRKQFIESKKYGNEYFEGDKEKMKKLIFNYIEKETEDVIKEKEKIMKQKEKEKEIVNNKTCSKCKTEFKYIGNLKRHLLKSTNCKISIEEVDNIIEKINSKIDDVKTDNVKTDDVKTDDVKTDDVKTDDDKINTDIIYPFTCEKIPNWSISKFESILKSYNPVIEMLNLIYLDNQNYNFFKYNMSKKVISYLDTNKVIKTIDEETFKKHLLDKCINIFKFMFQSINFVAEEDVEEDSYVNFKREYNCKNKYNTMFKIISDIENFFYTSKKYSNLQIFLETHIRARNSQIKVKVLKFINNGNFKLIEKTKISKYLFNEKPNHPHLIT